MINVTRDITLDEKEIKLEFVRSSGPGGQNVNKVSTAVLLRFDVKHSPNLSDDIKKRLRRLSGKRMTDDGVLSLKSQSFRTQEQNRKAAVARLVGLIRKAAFRPKTRLKTVLPAAKKRRRMENKLHRSRIKNMRRQIKLTDE